MMNSDSSTILLNTDRLAPQLPQTIQNSWEQGCWPIDKSPPCPLNSLTKGLLEETFNTSPDAHYPCPLRDLKLQVLPLVASWARIFLFEELDKLPGKLADEQGYWLTDKQEDLMVQLIDDWYDWYDLAEFDDEPEEEEPIEASALVQPSTLVQQSITPILKQISPPMIHSGQVELEEDTEGDWTTVVTVSKKTKRKHDNF